MTVVIGQATTSFSSCRRCSARSPTPDDAGRRRGFPRGASRVFERHRPQGLPFSRSLPSPGRRRRPGRELTPVRADSATSSLNDLVLQGAPWCHARISIAHDVVNPFMWSALLVKHSLFYALPQAGRCFCRCCSPRRRLCIGGPKRHARRRRRALSRKGWGRGRCGR